MSDVRPLPYNGQEGQPCPFGCVFIEEWVDGEKHIRLIGDCRVPESCDCYLNQQLEDKEDG